MNIRLLKIFSDYEILHQKYSSGKATSEEVKQFVSDNNLMNIDSLIPNFYSFLLENGYSELNGQQITINVAGKNFGMFDFKFIQKLKDVDKFIRFKSRVLDPAILCVDWKEDRELPSLNECKRRKGIEGEVSHDAIEDAWDVIQVLRGSY
jgi:hypothetical protein